MAITDLWFYHLFHELVAFCKVLKDFSADTGSAETFACMTPGGWEAMAVHYLASAASTDPDNGGLCKVIHRQKSHDFLCVVDNWLVVNRGSGLKH